MAERDLLVMRGIRKAFGPALALDGVDFRVRPGEIHGLLGGNGAGDQPPPPPKRPRSYWPFLLDLGLVLALFGLIITGRPLMVVGAVIFVVALVGWIREARADYSSLAD